MPLPLAIPFIAAAVPSLVQAGVGFAQQRRAKQFARKPAPTYTIPSAITEYVRNARAGVLGNQMPGLARTEENIATGMASGISAAKEAGQDPSSIMAAISGLGGGAMQAQGDLQTQVTAFKQSQQDRLNTALQTLGQAQDKEFDINKMQPYLAAMAASSALREAGGRNLMTSVSNLGQLGVLAASGGGIFGKGQAPSSTGQPFGATPPTVTPAGEMSLANPENIPPGMEDIFKQYRLMGYSDDQIWNMINTGTLK